MKNKPLPEIVYLPYVAKRWGMDLGETIPFFIGHNVISVMLENVHREIMFHDHINEIITKKSEGRGLEAKLPPKIEQKIFLEVPVSDAYLDTITKKGCWKGPVFIQSFRGMPDEDTLKTAYIYSSLTQPQEILITDKDLFLSSTNLLEIEKEIWGLQEESSKKVLKDELEPRSERTYLNIIGALLEITTGIFKDEKFSSETQLRTFIAEKYDDIRGVSPRTLADKFALAKKALNGELD